MIDVVVDLAFGDCGKGKIVDLFAKDYDVIARFNGGDNCGHVVYVNGKKYTLHLIPSGILYNHTINILGNGVVINPISLKNEIEELEKQGIEVKSKLFISKKSHIITPIHILLDDPLNKIGSTKKGIGPTYTDKIARTGIRVEDILNNTWHEKYRELYNYHKLDISVSSYEFDQAIEFMKELQFIDCEYFINDLLKNNKTILAEGGQGALLDIDHGTFPHVTSSNTISAGVCTGLGVAPNKIGKVYGITKAYMTRVGNGFFTTELKDEIGDKMCEIGKEYGSTTGRKRRCGWLDLVSLDYACMINGVDFLIITKVDVLDGFDEIKICTFYKKDNNIINKFTNDPEVEPHYFTMKGWKNSKNKEELSGFIDYIEKYTETKIKIISVGPERDQNIIF